MSNITYGLLLGYHASRDGVVATALVPFGGGGGVGVGPQLSVLRSVTPTTPAAVVWASTGYVDFVADCGADPTGVDDCAPAWDRAFAILSALAADPALPRSSVILFLPPGKYTLRSNPIVSTWNFQNKATTLYIEGAGQDTTLFQFAGFDLPEFANMYSLFVRDITFVGTSASYLIPDCVNGIGTNVSNDTVWERVKFYNIAATQSILTLGAAQSIVMRDCQIAACGATTNAKAMIVVNQPEICRFENVKWLDIGLVNGFSAVGKDNANFKHLQVIGSTSYKDGLIEFDACFWDESTTLAVDLEGDAAFKIPHVRFQNCYFNSPTGSGPCIRAVRVDLLELVGVVNSGFHAASTSPVVEALNVGHVKCTKIRLQIPSNSHKVTADGDCVFVEIIDCPSLTVDANASVAVSFVQDGALLPFAAPPAPVTGSRTYCDVSDGSTRVINAVGDVTLIAS